jgi:hypothetical protein
MMIERLLVLCVAMLVAIGLYYGWRLYLRWRQTQLATRDAPAVVAQWLPTGPALLYFTTEECVQCRFQQAPILTQLAQSMPVTIHKLDALVEDELARFFGIMTVPTTIWLDQNRRPAAINHGLATLPQLRQQALEIGTLHQ